MDFKALESLKIERWYHLLIIFSAIILGASLTVPMQGIDNNIVQLFSMGTLLVSVGEWTNHIKDVFMHKGHEVTSFPRQNTTAGIVFDILGIVLVVIGLSKLI